MRGETNGLPGVREQQKVLLVCSLVVHVSGFGCNEDMTESQFVVFTKLGAPQCHQELKQATEVHPQINILSLSSHIYISEDTSEVGLT